MENNIIGTVWNTYQGFYIKIVDIVDKYDVIVEFNDGERCRTRLSNVKLGIVMKPTTRGVYFETAAAKYEGSIIPTVTAGTDIKVIKYIDKTHIEVELLDSGYRTVTNLQNLRKGAISNPYLINKYGGYLGEGEYRKVTHKKAYDAWMKMLLRVASSSVDYVCDEWKNFQNFANWYTEYIESLNKDFINEYQLDKNLFQESVINKVYSPQTCTIMPMILNVLINYESSSNSDSNLPLGVRKLSNRYQVCMCDSGNKNYGSSFGSFDTAEKAFEAYKKEKERIIKEKAQYYYSLGAIRPEVYNTLMNWVVTDIKKISN